MALKCPYLTKITFGEIFRNNSNIMKNIVRCPFVQQSVRSISDYKSISNTKAVNTVNGFKCPFINDEKVKNLLVEKKYDSSTSEFIDATKKTNTGFNYGQFFDTKIDAKKKDNSYRIFKRIVRKADTFPIAKETINNEERDIIMWCSNDYLGLGRHPYVKSEVINAVNTYGSGSGGTRNISGSTPLHDKLESVIAKIHQKESALLFTSCYVANDTSLYTLAKMLPNCHILSDSGNHASMIQGIRNSNVPKHIFRHNDVKHLEQILQTIPKETPKIVAFESVHSMDGSICNIEEMCDVTHKYGGLAFVDEVHAVGLYGENGAGIGERDNVLHKMDIISGTLGKAFGNIGGYIAGSNLLIDTLRSYGSGFIFTTSLPPSVAAGALASISISCSDEGRYLRNLHQHNAAILKHKLISHGLPVMSSPSHIVPIMVGDAKIAAEICNILLEKYGIYIQSINYPTVARGEERLRIVPTPLHTEQMIDYLTDSLVQVWKNFNLSLNTESKKEKNVCNTCKNELSDINSESCKNFIRKSKLISVF